jgi:hypothetical protein
MRSTIHLVSRREFWLYAVGIRRARREWWMRVTPDRPTERAAEHRAERIREALADGPMTVAELGAVAAGFLGDLGVWVELVRVPPSGTWERRRADRLALAEQWVGPCEVTEDEGLRHLIRAYLRGFGPAPLKDVSSWSGVPVAALTAVVGDLDLVRHRDERGRELLDLPDAPLPGPDTAAPVRFLPHWDANLLVHARRTGVLPEAYRPRVFSTKNPFSVGTILVDGAVAGQWQMREGRLTHELYHPVPATVMRDVRGEAARLEAFHA